MRRKKNKRERETVCGRMGVCDCQPSKNEQTKHARKPPEVQQQRASVFIKQITAHVKL